MNEAHAPLRGERVSYRELGAREERAAFANLLKLRPLVVGPMMLAGGIALASAPYPAWRWMSLVAIAGVLLALLSAFALRAKHIARRGPRETSPWVLGVIVVLMSAMVALSGGLRSPLTPIYFTLSLQHFAGRARTLFLLAMVTLAGLAMAWMPASWTGPAIPTPAFAVALMSALLAALALLAMSTTIMQRAAIRAGDELERARREALETALSRSQTLEMIGGKVAHDLKNPLSAIKALVDLLAKSASDERARERFDVVRSEIVRMNALISEYLSFSRPLESLRFVKTNLTVAVDEVVAILSASAEEASVDLARVREGIDDAVIEADPRALRDALLNVVSNAIAFTPKGGQVTVEIARAGAAQCELRIRDTGEGMTAEELAQIGNPYFTRRPGGTGLGVVLARTVFVQHGGSLSYESAKNSGTTAIVRLPMPAT